MPSATETANGDHPRSGEADNETLNVADSKAIVGNIVGATENSSENKRESKASPSDSVSQALQKNTQVQPFRRR